LLSPILEIVPLQLFAYYVAAKRGLDVDRPRNLVKAVTLDIIIIIIIIKTVDRLG